MTNSRRASGAVGAHGAKSLAQLRAMIRRRADMPLADESAVPELTEADAATPLEVGGFHFSEVHSAYPETFGIQEASSAPPAGSYVVVTVIDPIGSEYVSLKIEYVNGTTTKTAYCDASDTIDLSGFSGYDESGTPQEFDDWSCPIVIGARGGSWYSWSEAPNLIGSVHKFFALAAPHTSDALREYVDALVARASTPREIVGDEELNEYINASLQELYDLLVSHYGEDYFVAAPYEFTADGATNFFSLPIDFGKALGLDLQMSSGNPPIWTRVNPFNMAERNRYAFPSALGFVFPPRVTNVHYRIRDNQLWIEPMPAAGMVFRLHYIPLMPKLADSGTVRVWDVTNSDVDGYSFTVNGVEYSFDPSTPESTLGLLTSALVDVAEVVLHKEYGKAFAFEVTPKSPECIVEWSASEAKYDRNVDDEFSRIGITVMPEHDIWTSFTNSRMSQWLEYVVVDCVIKCKSKEESDVSLEMAQKAALLERIENMASHRDAGGPKTVTDVQSADWPWGSGNGGGGW